MRHIQLMAKAHGITAEEAAQLVADMDAAAAAFWAYPDASWQDVFASHWLANRGGGALIEGPDLPAA